MTNHETDLTNIEQQSEKSSSFISRIRHDGMMLGATALATLGFSGVLAGETNAKTSKPLNAAELASGAKLVNDFNYFYGNIGYSNNSSFGFKGALYDLTYLHAETNFYEAKGPCQYPSPNPQANSTVFIEETPAGAREDICGNVKGFSGDFFYSRKKIKKLEASDARNSVPEFKGWLRNSGLFQPVLTSIGNVTAKSIAEATGVRSVPHGKADNFTLTSPSGTSPDWHVVVDFANTENDSTTNPPLRSYTASGHGNTTTSYDIKWY